ncbi:hemagglutinin, partial [Acidithiobacillus ferrooxidans]|nr:hemagglutinin [Acidithiobacillus ferrooxidans]
MAALTQTLGLGSAVTQYGDSNNIASGPGSAAGTNDTAVGVNATSTGTNSVALGYNSSDGGQNNVVAVGSATQQRKIINVAPGTLSQTSTDAVNGSQLYATDQQQLTNTSNISNLQNQQKIDQTNISHLQSTVSNISNLTSVAGDLTAIKQQQQTDMSNIAVNT